MGRNNTPTTRLSRLIEAKGLTSEAIADQVGYSLEAVKSWRIGIRRPHRGAMLLLAGALGLSEEVLEELIADGQESRAREQRRGKRRRAR